MDEEENHFRVSSAHSFALLYILSDQMLTLHYDGPDFFPGQTNNRKNFDPFLLDTVFNMSTAVKNR